MEDNIMELWEKVLDLLKEEISPIAFNTFISDLKDANDIKGLLINCENNYINSYMNSYIADLENGIDTCIKAKRQGGKHGKK